MDNFYLMVRLLKLKLEFFRYFLIGIIVIFLRIVFIFLFDFIFFYYFIRLFFVCVVFKYE